MAGLMSIKSAAETSLGDANIAAILETAGAFEKFASQELPTFIREERDYQSFGRQILFTHTITGDDVHLIDGEPYIYYPKDFNSHSAFYGDDGQIPRYQIEGDGVNVGITTISSDDVTIHLKRLMVQKFNYLERVKELSSQSIVKAEDSKVLDLTERLLLGNGSVKAPQNKMQIVTTADTLLSKNHLVAAKKCLSQHDVPLAVYVLNQIRIDDILTWATNEIDQLTQREILESGAKYSIWGEVKLIPSKIVKANNVYGYSSPEFVGRMPILKDLTVKLTSTTNKLEQGLFMFEFIGFYLASQKAVCKLILEFNEGDDMIHFYSDDVLAREEEIKATGFGSLEGR